eukprot:gene10160-11837_t
MSIRQENKPHEDHDVQKDEKHADDSSDDDDELARIREKRLQELKAKSKAVSQVSTITGGEYKEIQEQEFLKEVTGTANVVVHFYHQEFTRCKIIDKHLEVLAKVHQNTKFLKIDSEKSMFFINKLVIRVLPTLVFFHNGIVVDRLVGFDDLGGSDEFKTEVLAMRIAKSGVLELKSNKAALTILSKSDAKKGNNNNIDKDDY